MAYIPDNLAMVINPVGGDLQRLFFYKNTPLDTNATIIGANFVTDFRQKGGRVGDLVIAVNVGTAKKTEYQCTAVSATGAGTLAVPTAI
jgi:hypothetical protein